MGKEHITKLTEDLTVREERKLREKSQEQTLMDMYAQAKAAGYQGSYEDWKRVMGK